MGRTISRTLLVCASVLVAALGAGGCCFGGGASCDPDSYVGHCEGRRYSVCRSERGYGFDFGSHVLEGECAADEECIDLGRSQVGCALAPATTCNPETFVGRCLGQTPVVCTSLSSWITGSYEVRGSACTGAYACVVDEGDATCLPTGGPPCPVDPSLGLGCVGNDVVACTPTASGGYVESFRQTCEHGCDPGGPPLGAHCR